MVMANHNLRTQNLSHPWFTGQLGEGYMLAPTDFSSDLISNLQAKQKAESYSER